MERDNLVLPTPHLLSQHCPASMGNDTALFRRKQARSRGEDVHHLTDQDLANIFYFMEELGFGNWGSVWLCIPRPEDEGGVIRKFKHQFAVKLIHRDRGSKAATARFNSLWHEMDIVSSFKSDPHPSIIHFHSFIITESYALITMTYLPMLVPVEVEEKKAREWFRSLLSAVDYLHTRGVVHNDIKPANILLSYDGVPVLVDFGFAEQCEDISSPSAFHSDMSYGTPEYLSPERARGQLHDTRKSDIWSLGITFFEILEGRTPFEYPGEMQMESNEDIQRYWQRTVRGKWAGTWRFSKKADHLLHQMLTPNADVRYTARQAMADSYWQDWKDEPRNFNQGRSAANNVNISEEVNSIQHLLNSPSLWKTKHACSHLPPRPRMVELSAPEYRPALAKSRLHAKFATSKSMQLGKGILTSHPSVLSPVKASPIHSSYKESATAKENISTFNRLAATMTHVDKENQSRSKPRFDFDIFLDEPRRAFGTPIQNNTSQTAPMLSKKPSGNTRGAKAIKVLGDIKNVNTEERDHGQASTSAKARIREWEREKERMREMERLQELEKERDHVHKRDKEHKNVNKVKAYREDIIELEQDDEDISMPQVNNVVGFRGKELDKENTSLPVLPMFNTGASLLQALNIGTPPSVYSKTSNRNIFKHSIKASIDKTVQLCKLSSGKPTPARESFDVYRPGHGADSSLRTEESDAPRRRSEGHNPEPSPLPVIKNAAKIRKVAAETRADRMSIWLKNVDKVVEDAKLNFEASRSNSDLPLPSLPPPPLSRDRSRRAQRVPRRVLAASQIFQSDENGNIIPMTPRSGDATNSASDVSEGSINPPSTPENRTSTLPRENVGRLLPIPEVSTPSRQRRATVSTHSPEPMVHIRHSRTDLDLTAGSPSPSKRREKSKSHGDLFQRHIASIAVLEAELEKAPRPEPTPRLSQVIDRNMILAPIRTSRDDLLDTDDDNSRSSDDLTSSPLQVEAYPRLTRPAQGANIPDTPSRHRIEVVYDRFLMATSGVKRVGKGYQSDNVVPVATSSTLGAVPRSRQGRTPMPPPVSSEDQVRGTSSMDEMGVMTYAGLPGAKVNDAGGVSLVRKAINLVVPKGPTSRRMSRIG